jgi:hypothetical protein
MPILVGMSLADRVGLNRDTPWGFRDLFLYLRPTDGRQSKTWRRSALVQPEKDGTLELRIAIRYNKGKPLAVRVAGPGVATSEARLSANSEMEVFKVKGARGGAVYRIEMESEARCSVLLRPVDGKVIHYLPPDHQSSNHPLCGGQYYTPQRLYTRATGGKLSYWNRRRQPYAIRDAETGKLLFRPTRLEQDEASQKVEAGRPIMVPVRGCRTPYEWAVRGTLPWFAAGPDEWFDPPVQMEEPE